MHVPSISENHNWLKTGSCHEEVIYFTMLFLLNHQTMTLANERWESRMTKAISQSYICVCMYFIWFICIYVFHQLEAKLLI